MSVRLPSDKDDDERARKRPKLRKERNKVAVYWFRGLFSNERFLQLGHFVENQMGPMIKDFIGQIDYPKGRVSLKKISKGRITCMVMCSDGYHFYTAADRGFIHKWHLIEHRTIAQCRANTRKVRCLAHCSGSLISGNSSKDILIWDDETHEQKAMLSGHTSAVNSLDISDDNRYLVSGSCDNTVRLWSLDDRECLSVFIGHQEWVTQVGFASQCVFGGSQSGSLMIWDSNAEVKSDDDEMRVILKEKNEPRMTLDICSIKDSTDKLSDTMVHSCFSMSMNSDHSMIITRDMNNHRLIIWQWPEMTELYSRETMNTNVVCFHPWIPDLFAVDWIKCGNLYLCVCSVHDLKSPILMLKTHKSRIKNVCFTPDGSRLICNPYNSRFIQIWDVSELTD